MGWGRLEREPWASGLFRGAEAVLSVSRSETGRDQQDAQFASVKLVVPGQP